MVLNDSRQDFSRINEIVHVLIKHGFESFAVYISSKNNKFTFLNRNIREDIPSDANVRLRFVLEELGTTFIKLGQTLSTYPELIGFDLAQELSLLQESAPVDKFEVVKEIVENEFNQPIEEIFDEFSEEPIASASIGQVHTAFLNDKYVAVKVQHPGIKKTVKSDIRIMKIIANRLDSRLEAAKSYNLPGLVEVFERDIKKELDYNFEAMNAIHLYDLLKEDTVYVPKVYREFTTSNGF